MVGVEASDCCKFLVWSPTWQARLTFCTERDHGGANDPHHQAISRKAWQRFHDHLRPIIGQGGNGGDDDDDDDEGGDTPDGRFKKRKSKEQQKKRKKDEGKKVHLDAKPKKSQKGNKDSVEAAPVLSSFVMGVQAVVSGPECASTPTSSVIVESAVELPSSAPSASLLPVSDLSVQEPEALPAAQQTTLVEALPPQVDFEQKDLQASLDVVTTTARWLYLKDLPPGEDSMSVLRDSLEYNELAGMWSSEQVREAKRDFMLSFTDDFDMLAARGLAVALGCSDAHATELLDPDLVKQVKYERDQLAMLALLVDLTHQDIPEVTDHLPTNLGMALEECNYTHAAKIARSSGQLAAVLAALLVSASLNLDSFADSRDFNYSKVIALKHCGMGSLLMVAALGCMLVMATPCSFKDAYSQVLSMTAASSTLQCAGVLACDRAREQYALTWLYVLHMLNYDFNLLFKLQAAQSDAMASAVILSEELCATAHTAVQPPETESQPDISNGSPQTDTTPSAHSKRSRGSRGGKRSSSKGKHDTFVKEPQTSLDDPPVRQSRNNLFGGKRRCGLVDVFAGLVAFAMALSPMSIQLEGMIEMDEMCHMLADSHFPDVLHAGDLYRGEWREWNLPDARVLSGGPECTPHSKAGKQGGAADERSSQVADMAELAVFFDVDIVLIENVPQLLECNQVMDDADRRFQTLGYERVCTELVHHPHQGGDTLRIRTLLWYEKVCRTRGLPPPSIPKLAKSSKGLLSHLLPLNQVPDSAWLHGEYLHTAGSTVSNPPTCARLQWGGPLSKLVQGSLVTIDSSTALWRVMGFEANKQVMLMKSSRKFPRRFSVKRSRITKVHWQRLPCHSLHHPARSVRAFGEWPVRNVQLIHDARKCGLHDNAPHPSNSSCVRPLLSREAWSLQELPQELYDEAVRLGADEAKLCRLAGNSIPQSMLSGMAEAVATRLEDIDRLHAAATMKTVTSPATASIVNTVLVLFDTSSSTFFVEQDEKEYRTQPDFFPTVQDTAPVSREKSVNVACALIPPALLLGRTAHGYLAAERCSDMATERVVVVPVTSQLNLIGHQSNLAGCWKTIDELHSDVVPVAITARLAVARFTSVEDAPPPLLEAAAGFVTGADKTSKVKTRPIADELIADEFEDTCARSLRQLQLLRAALLDKEQELKDGYYTGWSDRITHAPSLSEIPDGLRIAQGTYSDEALRSLSFTNHCVPPHTKELPRPKPQQVIHKGFKPTSIRSLLVPEALDVLIPNWVRGQLQDLHRYKRDGPHAVRNFNKPLALGQDMFLPEARGIIWDLRRLKQGIIEPVDFTKPIKTHFNLDFLRKRLKDFPDRELVGFLTDGVQFKADLEMQLVFLPHLISLGCGFASVEKDLKKLAANGWYSFFQDLPFVPCRIQPQGSVPRKLEERYRRVMEAGAPRKLLFDTSGVSVVSLNLASQGAKSVRKRDYDAMSHEEQQCIHQPVSDANPPELKPSVAHITHDAACLKYAANQVPTTVTDTNPHGDGEPCFAFADDLSNMFHQFALCEAEYWKVCVLYLPLDPEHNEHSYAVEMVLAMGLFQASNVAQRAAHALMAMFRQDMDAAETLHCDLHPELLKWQADRRLLSAHAQVPQDRLYVCHMYTDDTICIVIGVDRMVRALSVWRNLCQSINLMMAIADKRNIGTVIPALGAYLYFDHGLVVIPRHKVLRAQAMLKRLANKTLQYADYRSLLGLLEHFVCLNKARRNIMFGLYTILRSAWNMGPTDLVKPTTLMLKQARNWIRLLRTRCGCHFFSVLPGAAPPVNVPYTFHVYSDAALEGAPIPGLGGFFHGFWWTYPLTLAQMRIPIPHLEFVASIISFILFTRHTVDIDSLDASTAFWITLHTDGLATDLALSHDASKVEVMQWLHLWLRDTPEYKALERCLWVSHVYGEGNPFADAASRGYFNLMVDLGRQLRLKMTQLEVPEDLRKLVQKLLRKVEQANLLRDQPRSEQRDPTLGYPEEGPTDRAQASWGYSDGLSPDVAFFGGTQTATSGDSRSSAGGYRYVPWETADTVSQTSACDHQWTSDPPATQPASQTVFSSLRPWIPVGSSATSPETALETQGRAVHQGFEGLAQEGWHPQQPVLRYLPPPHLLHPRIAALPEGALLRSGHNYYPSAGHINHMHGGEYPIIEHMDVWTVRNTSTAESFDPSLVEGSHWEAPEATYNVRSTGRDIRVDVSSPGSFQPWVLSVGEAHQYCRQDVEPPRFPHLDDITISIVPLHDNSLLRVDFTNCVPTQVPGDPHQWSVHRTGDHPIINAWVTRHQGRPQVLFFQRTRTPPTPGTDSRLPSRRNTHSGWGGTEGAGGWTSAWGTDQGWGSGQEPPPDPPTGGWGGDWKLAGAATGTAARLPTVSPSHSKPRSQLPAGQLGLRPTPAQCAFATELQWVASDRQPTVVHFTPRTGNTAAACRRKRQKTSVASTAHHTQPAPLSMSEVVTSLGACIASDMRQRILSMLRLDVSPFALRPGADCDLASLMHDMAVTAAQGYTPTTLEKDEGHWHKYWVPFCIMMNTPIWRVDVMVSSALSPLAREREGILSTVFLFFVRRRIRPRSAADIEAKPASVVAPLNAVRRMHRNRGYGDCLVPPSMLASVIRGMKRQYIETHGMTSLLPTRMEYIKGSILRAMFSLPCGTMVGACKYDRHDLYWLNFHIAMALSLATGYRKAEVALAANELFSSNHLSCDNICWIVDQKEQSTLTLAQLLAPHSGFIVCVQPPISKADQYGEKYGNYFSYVRWADTPMNLANLLIRRERVDPVPAAERSTTPLIHHGSSRAAFTHGKLSGVFSRYMQAVARVFPSVLPPDTLGRYSWHSFRITLATMLAAAKVPRDVILRMLRWASELSLNIYCRPTAEAMTANLISAMSMTTDQVGTLAVHRRVRNLADTLTAALDVSDAQAAAAVPATPIVDDTPFYHSVEEGIPLLV